jgi:hypothetical protein
MNGSARTRVFPPGLESLDLLKSNSERKSTFTFRLEIRDGATLGRSGGAQNRYTSFADWTRVANAGDLVWQSAS